MKKLKLKSWVWVVLFIILFVSVFLVFLKIGSDRSDRIDKGIMVLIDQNAGDR